jgi:hypothetical protein
LVLEPFCPWPYRFAEPLRLRAVGFALLLACWAVRKSAVGASIV